MENKTFEELMKELEQLVVKLESGQTNLEDSLKSYKKGIEIIQVLNKRLEDAKKQVEIVGEKDDK